jgi:hypothetical protein
VGCYEDCLDLESIDSQTIEFNTWLTDLAIENKTANSSIGISDEVLVSHVVREPSDAIWDDCDQISQDFTRITNYQFFNFSFDLSTEFYKQGEENGFYFYVKYNGLQQTYNFSRQSANPRNSIVEIQNLEVNNRFFPEALQIDFMTSSTPTQIKTLYFAKEEGIILIILNNGVEVVLD